MADPISVAVRRGGLVEGVHRVHAVAVRATGELVAAAGDPRLVTFYRSSAKPLQALLAAAARPDLDSRELAIASASHLADAEQLTAVRSLLAKAPATEDDLECGATGHPPLRLNHNCSGKHAAMLALCRARSWPSDGYRRPEHPVQRAVLELVARAADLPAADVPTAVDGCGVPTFALALERMAYTFARFEELDEGPRVAAAMRAHPVLIRGERAVDTRLMLGLSGWIAKGGAEGLICAASPDGLGVALKVEDGNTRATAAGIGAFLRRLGHNVPDLVHAPVLNSLGEEVGETVALSPD
jgi:L-asparaginase